MLKHMHAADILAAEKGIKKAGIGTVRTSSCASGALFLSLPQGMVTVDVTVVKDVVVRMLVTSNVDFKVATEVIT